MRGPGTDARPPSRSRAIVGNAWTAIAVLVIGLGVATSLQPAPELDGNPAKGGALYQSNCTRCHAADGAGGVVVGAVVAPDVCWSALAPTFGSTARVRHAILSGLDDHGGQLDPAMPRFRGRLIDAEIDNIVAFLQTLPQRRPDPKATTAADSG